MRGSGGNPSGNLKGILGAVLDLDFEGFVQAVEETGKADADGQLDDLGIRELFFQPGEQRVGNLRGMPRDRGGVVSTEI